MPMPWRSRRAWWTTRRSSPPWTRVETTRCASFWPTTSKRSSTRAQLYPVLDEVNEWRVGGEQCHVGSVQGAGLRDPGRARVCPGHVRVSRPRVHAWPYVSWFSECLESHDCTSYVARFSHLRFGFGRRIQGDAFDTLPLADGKCGQLRKAVVVRNPRNTHMMTMGRLPIVPEDLLIAAKFHAECNHVLGCDGISAALTPVRGTQAYLTLLSDAIPVSTPGFSLVNNSATGTQLVSRYSAHGRVKFELLRHYTFHVFIRLLAMLLPCGRSVHRGNEPDDGGARRSGQHGQVPASFAGAPRGRRRPPARGAARQLDRHALKTSSIRSATILLGVSARHAQHR